MQSRYTIRLKNPLIRICPYIIHLQYFGCRTCVLQCLDDAVVRLEICFCIGKIPSNVHFNKSLLALLFDATATDTVSVKRCSTTQPSSDCVGRRFLEHDFADKALLHEHAVLLPGRQKLEAPVFAEQANSYRPGFQENGLQSAVFGRYMML